MTTDIKKLKNIELDIFKVFIDICKKNSLTYFLLGGTALGAVRHKGFIPWDDDIDVALPRKDYEMFLKIAQNHLPENMFLQTYETDKNYPQPFAKIRRNDTAFIEKTSSHLNINHGVYIDIFPLDGFPSNTKDKRIFRLKEKICKVIICGAFFTDNTYKKTLKKIILNEIIPFLFPNYQKAVSKLDRLYKKYPYDTSQIAANFAGAWGDKEVMPKSYFGKGSKGEFEGIEVNLPEKYHEYLTSLYGDYMTPPPPEKRIGHHYCTVIDLEKSYKNYM